jgi:hypothetical protein
MSPNDLELLFRSSGIKGPADAWTILRNAIATDITAVVIAERERCAKILRSMWEEREASHGNRAGQYHDGWTAALDLAERRILLGA